MSYILFSQTSSAEGQRNLWNSGSGQATAATNAAVVNGALVTNVANSLFDEYAIAKAGGWTGGLGLSDYLSTGALVQNGVKAIYDLSAVDATSDGNGDISAAFASAMAAGGNVLKAGPANQSGANDRTLDGESAYSVVNGKQTLNVGLGDVNWNDVKNVEVRIDSAQTGDGFDALVLRSFVDVRVKVGDTEGCRDAKEFLSGTVGTFEVDILAGKRGQVDGAQSDMRLDVEIDVWTNNSGWQNSFSSTGSVFDDRFVVSFGELAVAKGVSEFGLGAGKLVDGTDKSFDGAGEVGNQTSAYNGNLTTLLTNLGAGDDFYDATSGVQVVTSGAGTAKVNAELQTIDYVWGGSNDDTIKGGGNADFLFGDFGKAAADIGQAGDPTELHLKVGGSNQFADWNVPGLVEQLYQASSAGSFTGDADWARFQVPADYGVAGVNGIGVWSGAGGTGNGETAQNPEINSGTADVLGFKLALPATGAEIGLQLFYADDFNASGPVQDTETAIVTLKLDGAVVAEYRVTAAGATTFLSGADLFDVAFADADGVDLWNGTDTGTSTIVLAAKGGATFDAIELRSGGIENGTGAAVSDFAVQSLCVTVASVEGNDTIDGGSGKDLIEGGGDRGGYAVACAAGVELVTNGGFELVAADAAQQEGGSWYLTAGAAAGAGAAFGWTAAPTVLTFDDITLPAGYNPEAPIADGYGGFTWSGAGVVMLAPGVGGYTASSSHQIGFIGEADGGERTGYEDTPAGSPLSFERATPFDLLSARFSAAFQDGILITAEAFDGGGASIGTKTFTASPGTALLVDFSTGVSGTFAGAQKVTFSANDGDSSTNDYFGFDDLTFQSRNIEVQNGGTGGLAAFAGDYKLELDSHPTSEADPLVTQAVATCADGRYTLTFAFAERQGPGDGSSDFELRWDGDLVGTFTKAAGATSWLFADADAGDGIGVAISPNSDRGWAQAKVAGLIGDGDDTIGFQGLAAQTNTYGAFIDNVSLTADYAVIEAEIGDDLTGGADADIFRYFAGDGVDVIRDFQKLGGDVIKLQGVAADYTVSTVIFEGELTTLIESTATADDGAILVQGVTGLAAGDDYVFFA